MDEWQKVLTDHHRRYPLMQIEDFVKLTYQNVFGPRHLHAVPDEAAIRDYLTAELNEELPGAAMTPLFEDIGGGYLRVSLDAIRQGEISLDELVRVFFASMKASATMDDESVTRFKDQLESLLDLIRDGILPLSFPACRTFVDRYLDQGIRPIHHSLIYRQHYRPQYRVVNAGFIKQP